MTEEGADWDPAHARAETRWTVAELCRREPHLADLRGRPVTLDLEFRRGPAGDPDRFRRALAMFGYRESAAETDGTVRVSVAGVAFDPDAIWEEEERTARIALAQGYVPDGWGFAEP